MGRDDPSTMVGMNKGLGRFIIQQRRWMRKNAKKVKRTIELPDGTTQEVEVTVFPEADVRGEPPGQPTVLLTRHRPRTSDAE